MYYLTIRRPETRRPIFYVRTKSECARCKMWCIAIVRTIESVPIGGKVAEGRYFRKAQLAIQWLQRMRIKYAPLQMWWFENELAALHKAAREAKCGK